MHTVITENDESQWDDDTGVLYHFPKRYAKFLAPGTKVIYYKGRLKKRKYASKRLSEDPHYFGIAVVGRVCPDKESDKGDLFAVIENYQQFNQPVLAKEAGEYLEVIPESRQSNYWRDGVRPIDSQIYETITSSVSSYAPLTVTYPKSQAHLNDLEAGLESSLEGAIKQRFVTTYERNPKLRRQAVAIHGVACAACGFNFEEVYGEYAKGFIHIHHIEPVSGFKTEQIVDPSVDLVPLCANCHAMVHRRKDSTLSIEQLIDMLNTSGVKL